MREATSKECSVCVVSLTPHIQCNILHSLKALALTPHIHTHSSCWTRQGRTALSHTSHTYTHTAVVGHGGAGAVQDHHDGALSQCHGHPPRLRHHQRAVFQVTHCNTLQRVYDITNAQFSSHLFRILLLFFLLFCGFFSAQCPAYHSSRYEITNN